MKEPNDEPRHEDIPGLPGPGRCGRRRSSGAGCDTTGSGGTGNGPGRDAATQRSGGTGSGGTGCGRLVLNKPIKGFTFTGLVTVKESDLQAVLKPYIGQKLHRGPPADGHPGQALRAGLFRVHRAQRPPGDDARTTLIIQFDVKERPSVAAIEVKGNATVRTNEITDKILLKKGDLANQGRLQADVEAVKSLYLDKGYTDATVTAAFVPGDTDDHGQGGLHGRGGHAHDDQGDPISRATSSPRRARCAAS